MKLRLIKILEVAVPGLSHHIFADFLGSFAGQCVSPEQFPLQIVLDSLSSPSNL